MKFYRLKPFIALATVLISSVCAADPEYFPPGEYAIYLGTQRPRSPYPSINNYNTNLTEQGQGPNYPVAVSRHHIIPYNTLREFYNRLLNTAGEVARFSAFFNAMGEHIPFYASAAALDCRGPAGRDYLEAANLAMAVANSYVRAGGNNIPPGLDTFQEFYTWLPGNLLVGPNNRSDDPGDEFEMGAATIVGQDAYTILYRAYQNILRYNLGDGSVLGSIVADLTRVAARQSVYPLASGDWEYIHGKYRIAKRRNPRSTNNLNEAKLSDPCTDIVPTFYRMRAQYSLPAIMSPYVNLITPPDPQN